MSTYVVVDGHFYDSNELRHYGVKGMKWGIRRYQNSDGTLTAAGRKRAKQEYKEDNKKAYELGKNATIYGHAAARSMNRTAKLENKLEKRYEKDPEGVKNSTQRLQKKWLASAKTTQQLVETYLKHKNDAESHCKSLIDKYGDDAVASIKYRDVKLTKGKYSPDSFSTMNERTNNLSDYATAGLASVVTSAAMTALLGVPAAAVMRPLSTAEKARDTEHAYYRNNKQEYDDKRLTYTRS